MNTGDSVVVIIQARLASTRLPAKALLPIAGMPSVVLCALRARNTGLRVVVATSDTQSDDLVVEVLKGSGIEHFRGPHHDVLLRFAQATRQLPDEAIIVRLTADNMLPDGSFVQSVVDNFMHASADYVGAGSPRGGLPYGMSAEVFRVKTLRHAETDARSVYDREHVTPWIKRSCVAREYVVSSGQPWWPRLRCTLDAFEDYLMLERVFSGFRDPIRTAWPDLVEQLARLSIAGNSPRCPYRVLHGGGIHSVLTLGTVQLGQQYGIANKIGKPEDDEVKGILAYAADCGVTSIDTASVYGSAEERIGRYLPRNYADQIRITTKLDVLSEVPHDADRQMVASAVDASVYKSLHRLRTRRIDTLLLHRWSHRQAWRGAAWRRLLELRELGLIGQLGASVAYPQEAVEALADPDLAQLQVPLNILDGRWREGEFAERIKFRRDVIVHARSAFLQGMLLLPPDCWVRADGVDSSALCAVLDELTVSLGRSNRMDLCLAYARSIPWVTAIVVGVESVDQLRVNLQLVQEPDLSTEELREIHERVPRLPDALLNPALWRSTGV